jgi:GNAT superfamily N-acetyltransferase
VTSPNSPATVAALVDSLRDDPFYVAITEEFARNEARRRQALARYFDYSMSEGARIGRLVVWPDPSVGAAVWLLPAEKSVYEAEAKAKAEFLAAALGAIGAEAYWRIIDFMRPRSSTVVPAPAWYLSIVGVTPSAQGQGIGRRLVESTLAEADHVGVDCYLETFDPRNPRFYQRLGFSVVTSHAEPVTRATYTIMRRPPKTRSAHSGPQGAMDGATRSSSCLLGVVSQQPQDHRPAAIARAKFFSRKP